MSTTTKSCFYIRHFLKRSKFLLPKFCQKANRFSGCTYFLHDCICNLQSFCVLMLKYEVFSHLEQISCIWHDHCNMCPMSGLLYSNHRRRSAQCSSVYLSPASPFRSIWKWGSASLTPAKDQLFRIRSRSTPSLDSASDLSQSMQQDWDTSLWVNQRASVLSDAAFLLTHPTHCWSSVTLISRFYV